MDTAANAGLLGPVWGPVLAWYFAVQLCALAALPLSFWFFGALPDRGYSLAKILGVLLVGYLLWLGTALGVARNETGGAWLALAVLAGLGVILTWTRSPRGGWAGQWAGLWRRVDIRHVLLVEFLFLAGLAVWAWVRAHDPAANHTEQPMDLMLLTSIWQSPTYPPQDAWLAGYAIGYYYMGYWLLATVARLANTPPAIAYNVGQAAWFGLLLISCYGVGYNLLAFGRVTVIRGGVSDAEAADAPGRISSARGDWSSRLGGLLTMSGVALTGNLHAVLEWLYAMGAPVAGLARWVGVNNFPDGAQVTGDWYITTAGWWWWRTSRVLSDRTLVGGHIEVIDEFPMFSYVLGDNHPHVMAMPVALLVIAIAMNLLFAAYTQRIARPAQHEIPNAAAETATVGHVPWLAQVATLDWFPGGRGGLALTIVATGSLLFLNTWDFPVYWGLLVMCTLAAYYVSQPNATPQIVHTPAWLRAGSLGGVLIVGTVIAYLPYLLTAQSQAGGLAPNLFNPTRLPQFLVMFGSWLPALGLLIGVAVRWQRPAAQNWLLAGLVVLGVPLAFLLAVAGLVFGAGWGSQLLASLPLPPDAGSHGAMMAARWLTQGYTFLLVGGALAATAAALWSWYTQPDLRPDNGTAFDRAGHARMGFALLLLFCGLALVYLPEFVYLRDQFGTRMNTVFKFYYQAWLLFGIAASFIIVETLRRGGVARGLSWGPIPALLSLVLILAGLIFPAAATYSKTGGFAASVRTLDATAYVQTFAPEVAAALRWIEANVPAHATVLEGEGRAYSAEHNRVSTMTGRPTLMGWTGHERQWRGDAFGEMAAGRTQAIEAIYRARDGAEVRSLLAQWRVDYVYVSPVERRDYQMTAANEQTLAAAMDVVFDLGEVRIYRRVPHAGGE